MNILFCIAIILMPFLSTAKNDEVDLEKLRSKTLVNPIVVSKNPYKNPKKYLDSSDKNAVCAIHYQNKSKTEYQIKTYGSEKLALSSGAVITHKSSCGTCSSLQDLSVYLEHRDLTTPVRKCGVKVLWKRKTMSCLQDLGFTENCAETWYHNAYNTAKKCFWVCSKAWLFSEKFNKPDGSLNKCLQCDEDYSGPVFKAVAGRTRRNSGIESAIGRPDEQVYDVQHSQY